ncbi:hypothetical protein N7532_009895 [Penicillium argentinense]|uniref:EthD domain-containing protein n=1 Tax=Penicillium argentinense TaxID=1131581 RepID=A0A9W9JX47_9EURO|nr:uncharacterized protein N7532_009895 [Penicillium argentinense]KAJ5085124.1 hypothetical protein N7532_009895 [Penicillium argentinense]
MGLSSVAPVKLLIFARRREGMSKKEFDDYWRGPHAKQFMDLDIVKKHCTRYEQYHDDATVRAEAESAIGLPNSGWDGVAFLVFDSAEGAKAVFNDPDFQAFAAADEPRFCSAPTQYQMLIGDPEIIHSS